MKNHWALLGRISQLKLKYLLSTPVFIAYFKDNEFICVESLLAGEPYLQIFLNDYICDILINEPTTYLTNQTVPIRHIFDYKIELVDLPKDCYIS